MEALTIYQQYFPEFTPSCFQQDMIESSVDDLEKWDKTLRYWASNDYRPQSIGKMLEYYDKLQTQRTGDWVAEAIKLHDCHDPRLVEIAVLQVMIRRAWGGVSDAINSIAYFGPAIEDLCSKTARATAELALSGRAIEGVLQHRREQFQHI